MTAVPFDRALAELYLQALFLGHPGWINVCFIPAGEDADLCRGEFFPTTPEGLLAAAQYAEGLARNGAVSIYNRMTTLREVPRGRGHAKDTWATPSAWADLDFGDAGHKGADLPPDAESAKALVAEAGLPEPTIWVFSGGGWYPVWKWSRTLTYEQAAELVERIQDLILIASKKHGWSYGRVHDMARVLRLPGSSNMKTGVPRPCRIVGGSGKTIDPSEIPPAPPVEVIRAADPKAAPPPKKTTTPYREDGKKGPWDVFDEMVEWPKLLDVFGLDYVGSDAYGDRYVREGASSKHSLKVMHDTGCVVAFSTSIELPVMIGLTKAAVLAYWTGYQGDRGECLRDLFAGINPAGVPEEVIEAMRDVGGPTVVYLNHGQTIDPDQFMQGVRVKYVDDEPAPAITDQGISDQDVDDFINTFIRYDKPKALVNRQKWMLEDKPTSIWRHAKHLVTEAANGWYPAEEAIRTILTGCRAHGADPNTTVKMALAAFLNMNAKANAS